MARTDYGPEIKQAIAERGKPPAPKKESAADKAGDTPADMARDKARGIPEDSPEDVRIDARAGAAPHGAVGAGAPRIVAHAPADVHHINAAAGIAHAILGSRSGGGY